MSLCFCHIIQHRFPQKTDKFKATTMRLGHEWLLTPVMVFQNYHLIHHLYPNIPFHRYLKVWSIIKEEIMAKNPAIQMDLVFLHTGNKDI